MSSTTKMGLVRTTTMEPLLDGGFREATITKNAYRCDDSDCFLIWTRKSEAEECEKRHHVPYFHQRYIMGPITNGIPAKETFYPRYSIGRGASLGFTFSDDDETDMNTRGGQIYA